MIHQKSKKAKGEKRLKEMPIYNEFIFQAAPFLVPKRKRVLKTLWDKGLFTQ